MNTALAAMSGMSVLAGLLLVVRGLHPPAGVRAPARGQGRWSQLGRRPLVKSRQRRDRLLLGGVLLGVLSAALSGWILLVVAVPLAVVGLPWLLGTPVNRDIELLSALDRWVRGLAATLPTGQSVADAIRISRRGAPKLLEHSLQQLAQRLENRWTLRDGLLAMADDLDSPDADAVLAALILAANRGGAGATATMQALADSIQDRLRALRDIEAERAKPRVVVRQITAITLVMLAATLIFGGSFFAPYRSPMGQAILALLVSAYAGSLVMLRRMTVPRRRERILQRSAAVR